MRACPHAAGRDPELAGFYQAPELRTATALPWLASPRGPAMWRPCHVEALPRA